MICVTLNAIKKEIYAAVFFVASENHFIVFLCTWLVLHLFAYSWRKNVRRNFTHEWSRVVSQAEKLQQHNGNIKNTTETNWYYRHRFLPPTINGTLSISVLLTTYFVICNARNSHNKRNMQKMLFTHNCSNEQYAFDRLQWKYILT